MPDDGAITANYLAAHGWRDTGTAWQKTVGWSQWKGLGVALRMVSRGHCWRVYKLTGGFLEPAGTVVTISELDRLCTRTAKG